jgi:hypothetical protein
MTSFLWKVWFLFKTDNNETVEHIPPGNQGLASSNATKLDFEVNEVENVNKFF